MNDTDYRDDRAGLLQALAEAKTKLDKGCTKCTSRAVLWTRYMAHVKVWATCVFAIALFAEIIVGVNCRFFGSPMVNAMVITGDIIIGISFVVCFIASIFFVVEAKAN